MIKRVSADKVRPLRHQVLHPEQTIVAALYSHDEDEDTLHLGKYFDQDLVGVVTVYNIPRPGTTDAYSWRLRGMAVLESHRGKGMGRELLRGALAEVARRGGRLVWCDSRTVASGFYLRHGFTALGPEYDVPDAGPHLMMRRRVDLSHADLRSAVDTIPDFDAI